MESNSSIAETLKTIQENIQAAVKESKFHQTVRLVAASKFKNVEHILEAYNAGIRDFGENYVDEMLEKSPQVK